MGITQIFPQFYEDVPQNGAAQVGEFCWVPCPDPRFHVLENTRETPEATKVCEVRLVDFDATVHFKAKDKLPTLLTKNEKEEALMHRAKRRPCLVLCRACIDDLNTLKDTQQERLARALGDALFLVAPLFSCASPSKTTQFTPKVTARIRALYYPHLAYMRDFKGEEPGSILRLDRIFPTTLGVGMTRVGKRLHPDVMQLVHAQLAEVLGMGELSGPRAHLETTRELVKGCPPDGLA